MMRERAPMVEPTGPKETSMSPHPEQETGGCSPQDGIPFDTRRLDTLMEEARLDALLVTSKHSIQYMLGGYRYFFYSYMDAHGLSRYLPVIIYVKGRPEATAYIASPMETYEQELGKFWVPATDFTNMTTVESAQSALRHLARFGKKPTRVGVEMGFLPADAHRALQDGLPEAEIVDATFTLELLRAVKTAAELELLREASERVVDSMLAVIASHGAGATKHDLVAALRREEIGRGLFFEYCLITAGTSFNRAPSDQAWHEGEALSLDSGGNYQGYIGDLCRMAVLGEPDAELEDLLAEVDAIQQAARGPIRAGTRGGDIFAAADALVTSSARREVLSFVAHGMGIVSHEAPWLTDRASVPYAAYHADRPLESGMVISVETTMLHPRRGFIKLEDTVAVTEGGWMAFGDHGRGWNRGRS